MKLGPLDLGTRPLFLAPMEDVTDSPFRQMCREAGASVVYTEFVSSEAIIREVDRALHKLDFEEMERPFGIQLFGGREEAMEGATEIALRWKPDILDINFGCPVYKIVDKGAGAACLRDLDMMQRMAKTVVDAAASVSPDTPVTVKTRLGWDEDSIKIQEVALMLQEVGVKALTVHARTRNQKYKGAARWEWLAKIKETPGFRIPLIGNGDVTTPEMAKKMFDETGVDGVMIGRGAIGNPFIFEQTRALLDRGQHSPPVTAARRVEACATQLERSVEHHGERFGVIIMKKHYGAYLKGIRGGKQLRTSIITMEDPAEILARLRSFEAVDDVSTNSESTERKQSAAQSQAVPKESVLI